MIDAKEITFIITCYKSEEIINNTLKNIPKLSKKIIIENSGNKILKNLEAQYENLTCYVMKKNLGYGVANNLGIKNSKTKYIFIINPDVMLKKKDITNILKLSINLDFDVLGFTSPTEKINFPENAKFLKVNEVKGFAMLIKKSVLKNCLFDENIFLYLEEIDLCRRIILNGGSVYLLNYELNHWGGQSHNNFSLELEKSRNWHWMWSKFYYNKKYNGFLISFILFFPSLVLLFGKYIFVKFFNSKNLPVYECRLFGLISSILGKKSSYRPKL